MRYKVFSIRDRAADLYGRPFYSNTVGSAIRSFSDEINRVSQDNQLNQHPDDFDLYYLGEFDDSNGSFETVNPEMVGIGKDLKIKV